MLRISQYATEIHTYTLYYHYFQNQKFENYRKKVQVGKDQEKVQSEKDSHSKNRGGEKTKLTIRYLYHENIS